MFLKKISIENFRVLKDVEIQLQYLLNMLSTLSFTKPDNIMSLAKFDICYDNKEFYLEFIVSENQALEAEKSKKILSITNFNNQKVLLCKTNLDDTDILPKMSDKVYLAAPITQVFFV